MTDPVSAGEGERAREIAWAARRERLLDHRSEDNLHVQAERRAFYDGFAAQAAQTRALLQALDDLAVKEPRRDATWEAGHDWGYNAALVDVRTALTGAPPIGPLAP